MNLRDLQQEVAAIRLHPLTETNIDALDASTGFVLLETDVSDLTSERDEARENETKLAKELKESEDENNRLDRELEDCRALLSEVKDDAGTLLEYRERAEKADGLTKLWQREAIEAQAETAAMRKRKGIPAGIFSQHLPIISLLHDLAQQPHGHEFKARAEKIMEQIRKA